MRMRPSGSQESSMEESSIFGWSQFTTGRVEHVTLSSSQFQTWTLGLWNRRYFNKDITQSARKYTVPSPSTDTFQKRKDVGGSGFFWGLSLSQTRSQVPFYWECILSHSCWTKGSWSLSGPEQKGYWEPPLNFLLTIGTSVICWSWDQEVASESRESVASLVPTQQPFSPALSQAIYNSWEEYLLLFKWPSAHLQCLSPKQPCTASRTGVHDRLGKLKNWWGKSAAKHECRHGKATMGRGHQLPDICSWGHPPKWGPVLKGMASQPWDPVQQTLVNSDLQPTRCSQSLIPFYHVSRRGKK